MGRQEYGRRWEVVNELNPIVDCGLTCHEEWLPLPLEPAADVASWSQETAAELIHQYGRAAATMDPALFTQELRERAADSRGRGPVHAFALCLPGIDRVAAMLEVDFIHPDETVPEITLDWIVETFTAGDFGPPETATAQLPVGPTVRIRQNFAASDESDSGGRVLMETVTYGLRPPDTGSAVMMFVSWTVPGVADLVERMADDIAETLTVATARDARSAEPEA